MHRFVLLTYILGYKLQHFSRGRGGLMTGERENEENCIKKRGNRD